VKSGTDNWFQGNIAIRTCDEMLGKKLALLAHVHLVGDGVLMPSTAAQPGGPSGADIPGVRGDV
jgi:hypothetical protein